MLCGYCGNGFEPRKQGRRQLFCPGGKCRRAAETKDRRRGRAMRERHQNGRPVDFETARKEPDFQRRVAEILAWAEAQHPATLEAWGIKIEKQADNEGAEMVTRETAAVHSFSPPPALPAGGRCSL